MGHNPLRGDHITVALNLNLDPECVACIDGIAFQSESCAICKASVSMMTKAVKCKTRSDAKTLVQEFLAMATGKLDLDNPNHSGRLAVFAGVRALPTRVERAILPWHTLHAAFNSVASASTEAAEDPMHAPIGSAQWGHFSWPLRINWGAQDADSG